MCESVVFIMKGRLFGTRFVDFKIHVHIVSDVRTNKAIQNKREARDVWARNTPRGDHRRCAIYAINRTLRMVTPHD